VKVFFLGLVALFVLGATCTGCDVSPPAAIVDGATITQNQLNSQLSDLVQDQTQTERNESQDARCALELQGSSLPSPLAGAGESTVSSQLASFELSTLILDELVTQDLARRHHPVTASDLSAAEADLEIQLDSSIESSSESGSPSCAGDLTGRQLLQDVPSGFSSEEVRYLADEEQLAVAVVHVNLSTPSLERYYLANRSQFAEVCLSDIEMTTQAQAQSIRATIASGKATFAAEARQSSIDSQTSSNGGAIPCVPTSEVQNSAILQAISFLTTGQVSQPVQVSTSTGGTVWLLVQVNGRPEIPFAQVKSQIRLTLLSAQSAKVSDEFDRITSAANVTVDPRYGSWSHLKGIRPPVPPPAKDLLSPGGDPGASSTSALGG
jgi:PPIC-type PPIASE domain